MQAEKYVILGVLGGLTGEISISGIISSSVLAAQTTGGSKLAFYIMTNFNVACIFYMFNIFFDLYLVESNCVIGQHIGNSSSHYFYLCFDFFILFKSYAVSGSNQYVLVMSVLIYLHRIAWTVMDIYYSGGVWDPVAQNCNYVQYPLSGIGYNASDMICDFFCTIVSIVFTWKHVKSNFSSIGKVIFQENVIRSSVMLAVNSFEMYASNTWTDPFLTLAAFLIQNYTCEITCHLAFVEVESLNSSILDARCLNSELFWIGVRKQSVRRSQVKSHATSSIASSTAQSESAAEKGSFVASRISTKPLMPPKDGRSRASTGE
ncbi:UNVERIFIED_CONTAM: hypothetical protein HDU68_008433 [Siphonaria sp. JEL0065]|nr:hypothetical protein HDU68_008433 [Siphonaria sp. JEL0065]